MTLLELLRQEAGPERSRILVTATAAGVSNTLLLSSINAVARAPDTGDVRALFMYTLAVAVYIACARYTSHRTTRLIEAALHRIKLRVADKITRAELDTLERVKGAEICDRITDNTSFISETSGLISGMMQSAFLLVFAALYLGSRFPAALALVVLLGGAGAMKFVTARREFGVNTRRAMEQRVVFLDRLTDLLAGFKEIQFGRRRRRDVREHVVQASDWVRASSASASNLRSDGVFIANAILFVLLAAVVYTLRLRFNIEPSLMADIVGAVMFLWRPFMAFMLGIMPYVRANMALEQIEALERKLEHAASEGAPRKDAEDPWRGPITSIEVRKIRYAYPAEDKDDRFRIGPLSFRIDAGSVLFIVGGNGSGKSTLLKVLTGLYAPQAGELVLDGIVVRRENVASYREKISAIFSDFHLFAKLYGLAGIDEEAVHRLIARMRLEGQTAFVNRRFSKLTLSTGQRKRVAMIVALLEDRPICVFDEWAADQDPEFRQYFYDELLPMLRREGKTVIVVSHDDRYFHRADHILTMEDGRIRSLERPRPLGVTS